MMMYGMLYRFFFLNIECILDWVKFSNIFFDNVKCVLIYNCIRVDCCVNFKLLNFNVYMFFYFDRCNYIIFGGIEKKIFFYGFLDFIDFWGRVVINLYLD